MATPALGQIKVESSHASLQFTDAYSGFLPASLQSAAPPSTQEAGNLYVSPKAALSCAKGALTALGLETAAVLCLYGIWQLWRLFL